MNCSYYAAMRLFVQLTLLLFLAYTNMAFIASVASINLKEKKRDNKIDNASIGSSMIKNEQTTTPPKSLSRKAPDSKVNNRVIHQLGVPKNEHLFDILNDRFRKQLPIFITNDGQKVRFFFQHGTWNAFVCQKLPIGQRTLILPVYVAMGSNMAQFIKDGPVYQKKNITLHLKRANGNKISYIFIGQSQQEPALRLNITQSISALMMGYKFTLPENNIESVDIQRWKTLLVNVANILSEIQLDPFNVSIDPDPWKIRNRLEEAIYNHFKRHIRLTNLTQLYNAIMAQIRKQLNEEGVGQNTNQPISPEDYTVFLKLKLKNIYSLLLQFEEIAAMPAGELGTLDLANFAQHVHVKTKLKKKMPIDQDVWQEFTPNKIEDVLHHEAVQLSMLSPNNYLQTFANKDYHITTNYIFPTNNESDVSQLPTQDMYLEDYDLPTSMHIPGFFVLSNGLTVRVTFGSSLKKPENLIISADRLVDQRLVSTLLNALTKANESVKITEIHISTTTNGHDGSKYINSNHRKENGARAIDISRINGIPVIELGPHNQLVIALQEALDEIPIVRENFGPYFMHKKKRNYKSHKLAASHRTHIHFSVEH